MTEDSTTAYRRILGQQLAMNKETWRALQANGVTAETPLRLDFAYNAPDQGSAEALRVFLSGETDYDVAVDSDPSGGREEWSVIGSTQETTVSPEILDQWVDWMVSAGVKHACEFDGWGTEV